MLTKLSNIRAQLFQDRVDPVSEDADARRDAEAG